MNVRDRSKLAPLLVAAFIVIVPPAIYGGAYWGLTNAKTRNTVSGGTCRVFPSQWVALVFFPACLAESAITGRETLPAWLDPSVGPAKSGS